MIDPGKMHKQFFSRILDLSKESTFGQFRSSTRGERSNDEIFEKQGRMIYSRKMHKQFFSRIFALLEEKNER